MTGILEDMPEPEHGDLQRLGDRVRTERMARRWSKEAAARHARINSITWDRVERGIPNIQDTKYAAIATSFGWKPDGLLRILARLEPEPLAEPETEQGPPSESDPDTIEAIKADDRLTDEDKTRLIDLYERMRDDDNGHGRGRHLA